MADAIVATVNSVSNSTNGEVTALFTDVICCTRLVMSVMWTHCIEDGRSAQCLKPLREPKVQTGSSLQSTAMPCASKQRHTQQRARLGRLARRVW